MKGNKLWDRGTVFLIVMVVIFIILNILGYSPERNEAREQRREIQWFY